MNQELGVVDWMVVHCNKFLHAVGCPPLLNVSDRCISIGHAPNIHLIVRSTLYTVVDWLPHYSPLLSPLPPPSPQALCGTFLSFLSSPSASSRRMASSGLATLAENGRRPLVYGVWIVTKIFSEQGVVGWGVGENHYLYVILHLCIMSVATVCIYVGMYAHYM